MMGEASHLREQSTEPEWVEADRIPPDKTKKLVISKSEHQDLELTDATTTDKQSQEKYKDSPLGKALFFMIGFCCLILRIGLLICCLIGFLIGVLATLSGKNRSVIVFLYYCLTFLFFSLLTYYQIRPLNFFQIGPLIDWLVAYIKDRRNEICHNQIEQYIKTVAYIKDRRNEICHNQYEHYKNTVAWLRMSLKMMLAELIFIISKMEYRKAQLFIEYEYCGLTAQEWRKSCFVIETFI